MLVSGLPYAGGRGTIGAARAPAARGQPGRLPAAAGPVPARHGGQPLRHAACAPSRGRAGNYFAGIGSGLGWLIAHGPGWAAAHAALGLALAAAALANIVFTWRRGSRLVSTTAVLGALFIIGAGFNGASFLNYGHDVSSLVMAVLWALALACYLTGLYLVARPASR